MGHSDDPILQDALFDRTIVKDFKSTEIEIQPQSVIDEPNIEYYDKLSRSASHFGKVYSGLYPVGPRLPNFSSNRRNRFSNTYNEDEFSSSSAISSTQMSNNIGSDDKMYIDFPIRNFWKIAKTPIDMESPQIGYCRGFYYRLLVHPRGGSCNDSESSYLSVFLEALYHESYPDDWVFPNVRFQLSVVNFLDPKANITSWAHWTFSHDAMSRGWHKMVSHVRLTKAAGFVNDEGTVLIRGRAEPPFPRIWSRSPKCRPWNIWGTLPYRNASTLAQYKPCLNNSKQENKKDRLDETITTNLCQFHEFAENSNRSVTLNNDPLLPDSYNLSHCQLENSIMMNNTPLSIMDRLLWSSSNLFVPTLKSQLNLDFVPAFIHLLYHIKEFRRAVFSWNPRVSRLNIDQHSKFSEKCTERSKRSDSMHSNQSSIIEALQKTFAYMTLWPIAYSVKRSIRHNWQERIATDPTLIDNWCPFKCCKCGGENTKESYLKNNFESETNSNNQENNFNQFNIDECSRCNLPPVPDCSWIMKALYMNDLQRIDVTDPLMRFHCFIFGAIYLESAHSILQIAAHHRKSLPSNIRNPIDKYSSSNSNGDSKDNSISISSIFELEEDLRIPTEFDNTCRVLFSSVAEDGGDCFSDYSTCCLRAKHIHSIPKAIEHYAHRFKRFPETLFIYFTPPKNAKKGELFDVPFRLEASFLLENSNVNSNINSSKDTNRAQFQKIDVQNNEACCKGKNSELKTKSRGKRTSNSESDLHDDNFNNTTDIALGIDSNDEYSLEYASDDGFEDNNDISIQSDTLDDVSGRKSQGKSPNSDNFFGSSSQYMEKWYSLYGVIIREGDTNGNGSSNRALHQLLIRPEEDGPWFRICEGLVERLVPKIEFTEWKCHGGFFCAAAIYIAEDYIDSIAAGDVMADCDIKAINPKLYQETLDLLNVTEEELQYIPSWVSTQVNNDGPSNIQLEIPSSEVDHVSMCVDIANVTVCDSTTCVFGHPLMDAGLSIDPYALWMLVDYRWGWPLINSHFQHQEPLIQAFSVDPCIIISGKSIFIPSAKSLFTDLVFGSLRNSIPKLWTLLFDIMFGSELDSKDLNSILQVIPHLRTMIANIFTEIQKVISEYDVSEKCEDYMFSESELVAALNYSPSENTSICPEQKNDFKELRDNLTDDHSIQQLPLAVIASYDHINFLNSNKNVSDSRPSYINALLFINKLHSLLWPYLIHFIYDLLPVTITIRLKRLLFKNSDDLLFDPRLTPEDLCARFLTESKFLLESSCCPLNLIRFCDNRQLLTAAINQVAGALDTYNMASISPSCSLSCPTNRMVDRFTADMGSSHFVIPIVIYVMQILLTGITYRVSIKLLPKNDFLPFSPNILNIESPIQGISGLKDHTPSKQTNTKKRNSSNKGSNSSGSNGSLYINPLSEAIQHLQVNQIAFSHVDPYVFIPIHTFHAVSSPLLVNIIFEHDLIGRHSFGSEGNLCASRVLHVNRLATVRHLYSAIRKILYLQILDTRISNSNDTPEMSPADTPLSKGNDHSKQSKRNSSYIPLPPDYENSDVSWIPNNPLDVFCLYSLRPDTDPTRRGRLVYTYMQPNDFLENHYYGPHKSNYITFCDVAVLLCVPPELKLQPASHLEYNKFTTQNVMDGDENSCLYTCPSHIAHSTMCQSSRMIEKTLPRVFSPLFRAKLIDPLWSSTKFPMNDDSIAPLLIFKWFDQESLNITLLSACICEARKSLRDCIVSWVLPRARRMNLIPQNIGKETPNSDDYIVMEECHIRVCQNVRRWTSSIKKINRTTGDVFIVQKRSNGQNSTQPLISDCPFISPFISAALSSNSYRGLVEDFPSLSKDDLMNIIASMNSKRMNHLGIFNTPIKSSGANSPNIFDKRSGVEKSWLNSSIAIGESRLSISSPFIESFKIADNGIDIANTSIEDLDLGSQINNLKLSSEELSNIRVTPETSNSIIAVDSKNIQVSNSPNQTETAGLSNPVGKKKKKASKKLPGIPSLQKSSIVKALNAQRRLESQNIKSLEQEITLNSEINNQSKNIADEFEKSEKESKFNGDQFENNKPVDDEEQPMDINICNNEINDDLKSSGSRHEKLLQVPDELYEISISCVSNESFSISNLTSQLIEQAIQKFAEYSLFGFSYRTEVNKIDPSIILWMKGLCDLINNMSLIGSNKKVDFFTLQKEILQCLKKLLTNETNFQFSINENLSASFENEIEDVSLNMYQIVIPIQQRVVISFTVFLTLNLSIIPSSSMIELYLSLLPKADYVKTNSLIKSTGYKSVKSIVILAYFFYLFSIKNAMDVIVSIQGVKGVENLLIRIASFTIGLKQYATRNFIFENNEMVQKPSSDWITSLRITDKLAIKEEILKMTLVHACDHFLSKSNSIVSQSKKTLDLIQNIEGIVKFNDIDDFAYEKAQLSEMRKVGKEIPEIIKDSSDWCVVFKPPFWYCSNISDNKPQEFELILNSGQMESILSYLNSSLPSFNNIVNGKDEKLFALKLGVEIGGPVLILKNQRYIDFYNQDEVINQVQCQYIFLCHGQIPNSSDKNISLSNIVSNASNRIFSKCLSSDGSDCISKYNVCQHLKFRNYNKGSPSTFSLCTCVSKIGNINKIRAYMHYVGHTIVGDSKYLGQKQLNLDRKYFPSIFFYCSHLEFPVISNENLEESTEKNCLKNQTSIQIEQMKVFSPIPKEIMELLENDFEITERFFDIYSCPFYELKNEYEYEHEYEHENEHEIKHENEHENEHQYEQHQKEIESISNEIQVHISDAEREINKEDEIDINDDNKLSSSTIANSPTPENENKDFELPVISNTLIASLPGLGFGLTPFLGMPNSQYAVNSSYNQSQESITIEQTLNNNYRNSTEETQINQYNSFNFNRNISNQHLNISSNNLRHFNSQQNSNGNLLTKTHPNIVSFISELNTKPCVFPQNGVPDDTSNNVKNPSISSTLLSSGFTGSNILNNLQLQNNTGIKQNWNMQSSVQLNRWSSNRITMTDDLINNWHNSVTTSSNNNSWAQQINQQPSIFVDQVSPNKPNILNNSNLVVNLQKQVPNIVNSQSYDHFMQERGSNTNSELRQQKKPPFNSYM